MFDFFKKKLILEKLEKAKALGLITEEEFFTLKVNRAKKELKKYLKKHSGKKR